MYGQTGLAIPHQPVEAATKGLHEPLQLPVSGPGHVAPQRRHQHPTGQPQALLVDTGPTPPLAEAEHLVAIVPAGLDAGRQGVGAAGSDEDVVHEIERGLLENSGRLWWTATPLAAGVKLLEYSENAQAEELEENPYHEEVILRTDDNITLPKEATEKFFEGMSEEEESVRREGAFLIQSGLVYRECRHICCRRSNRTP